MIPWLINSFLGDNINYQNVFKSNKKFLEQISDFDLKTYLNDDITLRSIGLVWHSH